MKRLAAVPAFALTLLASCVVFGLSLAVSAADQVEYLPSPATTKLNRPFSEAVRVGDMLYLSGFTGRIPGTNTVVGGGVQAETRQVMENIGGALDRYNSDFAHVVKCTVM